ncbi:hypothetical protein [Rhodoferax sp.]|jgi:hypothetical protein|uniref:hypothetical protein n=1 Tax=Rhodoferax sp. TaxID=50421 RepID=UPI0037838749
MATLKAHLFSREVLPFYLSLLALAVAALLCDAALHLLGAVWVGRWLGIPGVVLIVLSLVYSARKRKRIAWGKPATLLRWHEYLAWAGSLLVLVHAGIHFNAILGWLAVWAMLVNVASGLTGKFLLERARRRLEAARAQLRAQGLTPEQLAERTYWDSLTFDAVTQWRSVHFPITLAFAVLAVGHILAVMLFWSWR